MTSQLVLRLQLYPSKCRLGTTLGMKGLISTKSGFRRIFDRINKNECFRLILLCMETLCFTLWEENG